MEQKGIAPLLVGIIILGLIAIAAIALIAGQGNGNQQGQTTPTPTPTPGGNLSCNTATTEDLCNEAIWECGTGAEPNCNKTINCGPCASGKTCVSHKCQVTPTPGQSAETQGNSCTTVDGSTGITGPAAVEGVLFKWDFESIQSDTCGTTDKNMIFFCDPAQFSLSLAGRLEQIKKLAESGQTEKAQALAEFSSLLIADNYSEDFQKDFADYYSGLFFETPTWFEPWAKYFADENKLQFNPRNLKSQGSGLYRVKLNFKFEGKEFEFFKDKKPAAKITIEFSKLINYPGNTSIFHSIPINGMVGTTRKDSDGKTERKDYGIGFNENSQILVFQEGDKKRVDSTTKGGLKEFQVLIQDKFEQTNTKGGVIAFINESGGIITFAPQYAKTVLAQLSQKNNTADLFYWISENGKGIGQGKTSMAWWTTASGTTLQKFQGLVPDVSANSTIACTNIKATGGNAFGFHLTGLQQDKNILLKSYFFTPFKNAVVLENGCPETAKLFTENEKISNTSRQLALGGTENKISQFYELQDLAMTREICVVNKQGATYFQWNAAVLEEQEGKAFQLSGIKAEYNSGQITPKGTTRQPAWAGNRKIEIRQNKLLSGSDGSTKVLFTPVAETDGEIYLIADASNLGIFCFERPLVEIYKIDGNSKELLLKAKSSGFLGLSPKEYRGSIKKGERLKLTAKGFKKTLCSGLGSAEAYFSFITGTSGIAVTIEKKEINSYCPEVLLAEYPDTEIAKCSIKWGDNSTTSTTEVWPGPNVKPVTGPHIRSHCYDEEDGPLSYSISYTCEDHNGNSKSKRLLAEVPVFPEDRDRPRGAYCADCPDCCGGSLQCIPATEYPEGVKEEEKNKVCCPKETKWDGGLCLDYEPYQSLLFVGDASNSCKSECAVKGSQMLFSIEKRAFEAFRDQDWESSNPPRDTGDGELVEDIPEETEGGGETTEGCEETATMGEDETAVKPTCTPTPAPTEKPGEPGWSEGGSPDGSAGDGGDSFGDGGGTQEPEGSEIGSVLVDIYYGDKQLDSIALSEDKDGDLSGFWSTSESEAGEYIAKFKIYANNFSVNFEKQFTLYGTVEEMQAKTKNS